MAIKLVVKVAKTTTDIELSGISIAEITGERVPCTAKLSPITLYKNDIIKLIIITFLLVFEKFINVPSLLKEDESSIPSQAGEKLFIS
ncbi:MAG: hypothetical protein R3250_07060, partial [Melioribacteraceae bacterium]|nr:hypothetical protein [Melioribacteraceae bacterium]